MQPPDALVCHHELRTQRTRNWESCGHSRLWPPSVAELGLRRLLELHGSERAIQPPGGPLNRPLDPWHLEGYAPRREGAIANLRDGITPMRLPTSVEIANAQLRQCRRVVARLAIRGASNASGERSYPPPPSPPPPPPPPPESPPPVDSLPPNELESECVSAS